MGAAFAGGLAWPGCSVAGQAMTPPAQRRDKNLGEIVSEVSEKASLLVREEIELAKAEVTAKVKTLGKGAGVGAAAGVFLIFAVVFFLERAGLVLRGPLQRGALWSASASWSSSWSCSP